jgi:alanine dehydrogenase
MTLILSNEEIEKVFSLDECFAVLEPALLDLGNGHAVSMPRQDLLVPGPLAESYHGLKTSCASWPQAGVTTMRVTSDVLTWPVVGGKQRRVKVPLAMGGKYVGLVLLFSVATGELLAIFPDGFMQAIRVGVTNALSAKYLARKNSRVMALYGSGWQARPALLAMGKVLPIEEVRVYSPSQENREKSLRKWREDRRQVARWHRRKKARGADIVSLTTNALEAVFPAGLQRHAYHHGSAERDDA